MLTANPLPASCVLLLAGIPGVWLAGWMLAKGTTDNRRVACFLSPGLAAAAWLLSVHFAARWAGSLRIGLWAGTLTVAAVGLLGWAYATWRRPAGSGGDRAAGPRAAAGLRNMVLSALAATAIIAPMTLSWAFHDEQLYTGHTGIIAQLQNDHYPPRHMTFPELEYRYHYGFDLAAAAVTAVLRVSPGVAIDIITLLSWSYTWCLLWVLGDELLGRGRGWLTAVITLFGGGLPYLLALPDGYYVARFVMICEVGGMDLNPPMISYFFQHPLALGLPLAVCATLIILDRRRAGFVRYISLALLLAALSFSQAVVFAALAGAIPVAEVFSDLSFTRRRVAGVAAAVVVALLVGRAAGGLFLPPPDGMGLSISLQAGVAATLIDTIVWHVLTYGLLLPLGACGFFFLPRGRLFLALLLAGSLGVLNLLRYAHSWDLVKFGTVAALALSIATSATVARVFALRPALLGVTLGLLLVGVTADGLAFPLLFALDAKGIPLAMYPKEPSRPPSSEDLQAIAWLRGRVSADEIVYRKLSAAIAYDHVGGLAVPWYDGLTDTFGFSRQRMERRRRLLVEPSPDPDAYDSERIGWFVLGPGDSLLSRYVDDWTERGRARVEARFGSLRIVRLLPRQVP